VLQMYANPFFSRYALVSATQTVPADSSSN
jgi:hypothetical protein